MIWIVFLVALVIIFAALAGFFFLASLKATQRVQQLEYLFLDTLEDIQESANIFHQLVKRRSLLSDDPDIQRIQRVFGVTLDILREFIIDGKQLTAATQKERQKEKEEE